MRYSARLAYHDNVLMRKIDGILCVRLRYALDGVSTFTQQFHYFIHQLLLYTFGLDFVFCFFFALITRHSLITSETEFVYVTNRSSLWNVMQYKYKIELIRIEVQWPRSKTEIISQRAHCNGIYTNDIIVWTVRVVCICIQNNKNAICMYRVVNYDVFIYIYIL